MPKLSDEKDSKILIFVRYNYGDALRLNRYGILEPAHPTIEIDPHLLDLVLTPLVAFDPAGHRLGTGGGFYDSTFKFKRDLAIEQPVLIGLGYAAQQTETIPSDDWDIRLSGIVTEKGFQDSSK